jgi:hypothetical protein
VDFFHPLFERAAKKREGSTFLLFIKACSNHRWVVNGDRESDVVMENFQKAITSLLTRRSECDNEFISTLEI